MEADEIIINGPRITVPISNDSLGIRLHVALRHHGQAPLFTDAISGETVSRSTVLKNSCYLGQSFRNYGLVKGDIIAVCSENHVRYFDPILGALYSGITVSLFSPQYTDGEFVHVANISQPSIIFCSKEASSVIFKAKDKLKRIPQIVVINVKSDYNGCKSLDNFIADNTSADFNFKEFVPCSVNVRDDVGFILHSSGTTGLPKGVMLTHFNYNTTLDLLNFISQNTVSVEVGLLELPLHHAYGLFKAIQRLLIGGHGIILKKFDPNIYLKTIQQYKIERISIVPSMANFLAKSELVNRYDLSSIKLITCGSAPLSGDIENSVMQRLKVDSIRQGYGMTESTVAILVHPSDKKNVPRGSSGSALPNISIKIVDIDTGRSLGPMKVGELWCRGDMIMKGYFNNPEATRNAIDEHGWLHTGDIAYYDHDHVFYIVDRLKELIKCKGFQVAPAELESILLKHSKIAEAGVIGVPHDRDGEVPFAFVVKVSDKELTENEVQNFVNEQVAPFKRLRGVQFISQIPRNSAGKILRRLLRDEIYKHKSHL